MIGLDDGNERQQPPLLTDAIIFDFDGGTRIGEAFATLLANSRFVSFARGAVIIVLSDGLERGDPALMAETTERLAPVDGEPPHAPEQPDHASMTPHSVLGEEEQP